MAILRSDRAKLSLEAMVSFFVELNYNFGIEISKSFANMHQNNLNLRP
jgi:hypothetical protein